MLDTFLPGYVPISRIIPARFLTFDKVGYQSSNSDLAQAVGFFIIIGARTDQQYFRLNIVSTVLDVELSAMPEEYFQLVLGDLEEIVRCDGAPDS